jgi:hypothetical protein
MIYCAGRNRNKKPNSKRNANRHIKKRLRHGKKKA